MSQFNRLTKNTFNPDTLARLPSRCAIDNGFEGAYVVVIKGMTGYLSEPLTEAQARHFNRHQRNLEPNAYDPTRESTQEAMRTGSMFGWEVPGIDPAMWIKKEEAA